MARQWWSLATGEQAIAFKKSFLILHL